MNLQHIYQWCYNSRFTGLIRDSAYAIPLIQSVHLVGLTLLLATIMILSLRLLGLGMSQVSMKVLARQLWPWSITGLILAIVSGFFVFLPDPVRYLDSTPFLFKMGTLAVAIIYHLTVFRKLTRNEPSSRPKVANALAGMVTLTLWFSVGWAGRAIAFFR